jgi:hypothetical protein
MKSFRIRRGWLMALTALALSWNRLAGADPAWLPPVRTLTAWLDPKAAKSPTVQLDLELAGVRGVVPGVTNLVAAVAFHLPDRFQLESVHAQGRVQLLRHGRSLWLWQAGRQRWCRSVLPSDTAAPGFPAGEAVLGVLAHGCDADVLPSRVVEGHPCSVFRVRPTAAALGLAGDFHLTLWVPQSSSTPLALRWQDPSAGIDFTAWLRRVRIAPAPSSVRWIPQPADSRSVEVLKPDAFVARIPEPIRFIAVELGVVPMPGL